MNTLALWWNKSVRHLRVTARLMLLALAVGGLLSACAMDDLQHYQNSRRQLDLEKYFVGTVDAWGMFQKRDGTVVKQFHVVLQGKIEQEQLVLDEQFSYDDGSKQQRIWRLRKQLDGTWRGQAADVKGEAVGTISGNALNWRYTLLLPVDGSIYEMQMDDWMYLQDEHHMFNRASMRKFGIEVGQVTLFFKRRT